MTPGIAMDERCSEPASIWDDIPTHIIERVLLWLPMRSLIRAASVCKDWHYLIFSDRFAHLHRKLPAQLPWLLVFPEEDLSSGLVYDPALCTWFNFSFSFLPHHTRVVAASQGLVCFIPKSGPSKLWYICNPISKTWQELPSPPAFFKLFFSMVGLFVEKDAHSFTIVIAGSELVAEDSERFILITEIYESTTRRWKRGGGLVVDAPLSPWKAVSGRSLYCITGSAPHRVLGYDCITGLWSEVCAPLPEGVTGMRLMDHKGKLLMIAEVMVAEDIGIWELHSRGTESEWKEVGRMPRDVLHQLLKTLSRRFACVGQDDVIYFSSNKSPRILEHNLC